MKSASLALAALVALGAAGVANAQSASVDWRAAAAQDLQSLHDVLRDNHPAAVVDKDSQRFRTWLDAGLAQAQAKIPSINSARTYAYVLAWYANGFHDSNIELMPNWQPSPPSYGVAWNGFTTAWRDGAYVVASVSPGVRGVPPLGARLNSCDGMPADQFARARLDGFEGDLDLEADRVRTAPYLFWDRANNAGPNLPASCEFQVGRGKRTFRLAGNFAEPEERAAAYGQAVYTVPATPLAIEMLADGTAWVHVHSLMDDAGWDAFYAQVDQMQAQVRAAPKVVFDMRGAEGGNPRLGYRLINRLWDPVFIQSKQPTPQTITYRVSTLNRQYYAETVQRLLTDPYYVNSAPAVQAIVDQFDQAATAGQPSFTQSVAIPVAAEVPANPMTGQVMVLTDAACTGACLDLMDLMTRLPNVRQIGNTTSADSIFIEQSRTTLASGNAYILYGHKAYVDRPRATNQPYTPGQGLVYTGNASDEGAVRAWVATLQ